MNIHPGAKTLTQSGERVLGEPAESGMDKKTKIKLLFTSSVCVRIKDMNLQPCDYRELNEKYIPDRYPIHRVQDMLQQLTGQFLVLSAGTKARHITRVSWKKAVNHSLNL